MIKLEYHTHLKKDYSESMFKFMSKKQLRENRIFISILMLTNLKHLI
jgi:hypothetical protein